MLGRIELDQELNNGRVSAEGWKRLWAGEVYGTATPMQCLGQRLCILQAIIDSGRTVEVHTPSGILQLRSSAEFHAWCKAALPDGYECFLGPRPMTR